MVARPDALQWPVSTHGVTVQASDGVVLVGECHATATTAADAQAPGGPVPADVLLAHGFGQTRQAWAATAARLATSGHCAAAFDGRGHGQSGTNPPEVPYRLDDFVSDALALAGATASAPTWVGASMGGLLGLLAQGESEAAGARAPFAALVLVDITPRWERAGVERILGFMRAHPKGFATMDAAIDAIAAYLPQRRRKTPQQLQGLLVPDAAGGLRWHWDPRLLDELAHQADRWQDRLAAAARRISIPTLLVSGGRSDLVSHETVDEFLGLVPHAAHVRIDQATHMVAGDRNDAFTDAILDFLTAAGLVAAARNGAAP